MICKFNMKLILVLIYNMISVISTTNDIENLETIECRIETCRCIKNVLNEFFANSNISLTKNFTKNISLVFLRYDRKKKVYITSIKKELGLYLQDHDEICLFCFIRLHSSIVQNEHISKFINDKYFDFRLLKKFAMKNQIFKLTIINNDKISFQLPNTNNENFNKLGFVNDILNGLIRINKKTVEELNKLNSVMINDIKEQNMVESKVAITPEEKEIYSTDKIKNLIGTKGEENIDDINKTSFNINDSKENRDLQMEKINERKNINKKNNNKELYDACDNSREYIYNKTEGVSEKIKEKDICDKTTQEELCDNTREELCYDIRNEKTSDNIREKEVLDKAKEKVCDRTKKEVCNKTKENEKDYFNEFDKLRKKTSFKIIYILGILTPLLVFYFQCILNFCFMLHEQILKHLNSGISEFEPESSTCIVQKNTIN